MLISELNYIRDLKKDLETLEKMKREAQKADALTRRGEKMKLIIPKINEKIEAVKSIRNNLIQDLNDWLDSMEIDELDKKMIFDYYVDAKSKTAVQTVYNTENLYKKVKKYCFKF